MKRVYTLFSSILLIILAYFPVQGNNLSISNIQRLSAGGLRDEISFNLSWDNSWSVGGTPGNHDAVWIFIKFRECGVGGAWSHGLLDLTMSNHSFGASVTFADSIRLSDRAGNIPGGATSSNGIGHNTGILIKRSTLGVGNISNALCTLKMVNDAAVFDPSMEYDIRVFGIEMVQVINEGFNIGDGTSSNSFSIQALGTENGLGAGALYGGSAALPAAYPKGVQQFYCMKYEITQGQYAHFLNTVNGVAGSPALHVSNRNNLQAGGISPNDMFSSTPDRAQNYMSWDDLIAYLDWAALRPMTELEYEKVCRGPLGVVGGGYAWGNTSISKAYYINGTEDGTEWVHTVNANAHYHIELNFRDGILPVTGVTFTNNTGCCNGGYNNTGRIDDDPFPWKNTQTGYWTDLVYIPVMITGNGASQGYGPIGAGIFARDTTVTRTTTGGAFYGAMEMSGNVSEQCVSVTSTGYLGTWGNGTLNISGQADVADWPGGANAFVNRSIRGGGYGSDPARLRISDRLWGENTLTDRIGPNTAAYRQGDIGGRGVR